MPSHRHTLASLAALAVAQLALAPRAHAEESRAIRFVAIPDAVGSLSSEGQTTYGVHIFWDSATGALPPDLDSFRVRRNGTQIFSRKVGWTAPAATIAGWYNQTFARRLATEQARALCALDAQRSPDGTPSDACDQARVSQYRLELGARVHERLLANDDESRVWRLLAARVDPTIARAMGRGHLDRPALSVGAVLVYTLEAVSSTGLVTELASLSVPHPSLERPPRFPAPRELRQVRPEERGARCDQADEGLTHGTVALTWRHDAGLSPIGLLYADLVLAGYDIYRRDAPLSSVGQSCPAVDIAALAAANGYDFFTGRPQVPGFTRVNNAPESVTPGPGGDPTLVLELASTLGALGYGPGTPLCYYVVPRTRSGNYGQTAAVRAIVEDRLRPPAPWDAEVITTSAMELLPGGVEVHEDRFAIRWSHVDLTNYYSDFQDGRAFCNLDRAAAIKRLAIAEDEAACARATYEVPLDVVGYRVYRFESLLDAEGFRDTDGDGVPDDDEVHARPTTSDPCDPVSVPPNKAEHRINGRKVRVVPYIDLPASAAIEVPVTEPDPGQPGQDRVVGVRRQLVFEDPDPAARKGDVFWYRVVAVSANEVPSEPTPPIRAFFPNERLPDPPQVLIGQRVCDVTAQAEVDANAGGLAAFDFTCRANAIRFACDTGAFERCLAALEDPEDPEGYLREARCADALALRPGLTLEDPRLAGKLLVAIGESTVWQAPFDRTGCGLFLEGQAQPAVATLGPLACHGALIPRMKAPGCDLVAQLVGDDGTLLSFFPIDGDALRGDRGTALPLEGEAHLRSWWSNAEDCALRIEARPALDAQQRPQCELVPLNPGQVTVGPQELEIVVREGECASLSEDVSRAALPDERDPSIAGPQYVSTLYRMETMLCPQPGSCQNGLCTINHSLPPQESPDDVRCVKVNAHSPSNMVSSISAAACTKALADLSFRPRPPRLLGLELPHASAAGVLSWTPPARTIAGIILEVALADGAGYQTRFVGVERASNRQETPLELDPALSATGSTWCARARSVSSSATATGAAMSDWTPLLCATRGGAPPSDPALLDSIPWPAPRVPALGPELSALYLPHDAQLVVKLAELPQDAYREGTPSTLSCALGGVPNDGLCFRDMAEVDEAPCRAWETGCCVSAGGVWDTDPRGPLTFCATPICASEPCLDAVMAVAREDYCLRIKEALGPQRRFIVYRQARVDMVEGPFVQVSARIDEPDCSRRCGSTLCRDGERAMALTDDQLALVRLAVNDAGARDLLFVDRYPFAYRAGVEYRYEFVYFDADGEVVGSRQTHWVSIPAGGAP